MTAQEKDCIESAIRHIKTAVDVDEWACKIAVDAMEKQIPKQIDLKEIGLAQGKYAIYKRICPTCKNTIISEYICPYCTQRIRWDE